MVAPEKDGQCLAQGGADEEERTTSGLAYIGHCNHIFRQQATGEIPADCNEKNSRTRWRSLLDILVSGIDDLGEFAALNQFFKAIHRNLPNVANEDNSNTRNACARIWRERRQRT